MSKDKIVFGEVDWDQADVNTGNTRSDFMRLEEKTKNRVRILGNPVQFYVHWIELPDGSKRKINSPIGDAKLVKQLEDAGFKRQAKWFIKVLDRADGQLKLLEIGSQIYKEIKRYYEDDEWGPVNAYDVTITRGPKGSQPLYSVMPCPKSPLESAVKQAFSEFNDRIDLTKLTQPADPDAVRKDLGWKSAPKNVIKNTEEDEDIFDFDK